MSVALALLIVAAYAAALWWMLRRESRRSLLSVVLLCGAAVGLRLIWHGDYPQGWNQDEPIFLAASMRALREGGIFKESIEVGIPVLLGALFEAQLVPVFGPTTWAIRTYSLVASVLAVPVAFAWARACGLRRAASGLTAALVAVLPWAIFYGRIHWGGELIFHELLLLGALAAIIWRDGGAFETLIGGFALTLLVYDYFVGRAMFAMPLTAAVLARGRGRVRCLVVFAFGAAAELLYSTTHPHWTAAALAARDLGADPSDAVHKVWLTAMTFVRPCAANYLASIQGAAMHPPVVLVAAIGGLALTALRRPRLALFVGGGFVVGLAPTLVTTGLPSTHRMMLAFPFVALAAGTAVDAIGSARARRLAAAVLAAIAAIQSAAWYFAPSFWPPATRDLFAAEHTALVQAVPLLPHPRLIAMRQLGWHFKPHALLDPQYDMLTVDNWLPASGEESLYAFGLQAAALEPLYLDLFGRGRVRTFGRSFLVRLERRNWDWVREHGWTYEASWPSGWRRTEVPALFHPAVTFRDVPEPGEVYPWCSSRQVVHRWHGRWRGPRQQLRLIYSGEARVLAGAQEVRARGFEQRLLFTAQPGSRIDIEIAQPSNDHLLALLLDEHDERVPEWRFVDPEPPMSSADDGRADRSDALPP